jgi:DNA oxidative demethylase
MPVEASVQTIELAPDVYVLPRFAHAATLWPPVQRVSRIAPFRHMHTPGGQPMSAGMTNCGHFGWISDRAGYRYSELDPDSGRPWPAMPPEFLDLAARASEAAGFGPFEPDACLINRYVPGARMGSHQDRDELDFTQPIVSVSLGIPATFEWFGARRSGASRRVVLENGDVVVWGQTARKGFHAIRKLEPAHHALTGAARVNLTLRRAR